MALLTPALPEKRLVFMEGTVRRKCGPLGNDPCALERQRAPGTVLVCLGGVQGSGCRSGGSAGTRMQRSAPWGASRTVVGFPEVPAPWLRVRSFGRYLGKRDALVAALPGRVAS